MIAGRVFAHLPGTYRPQLYVTDGHSQDENALEKKIRHAFPSPSFPRQRRRVSAKPGGSARSAPAEVEPLPAPTQADSRFNPNADSVKQHACPAPGAEAREARIYRSSDVAPKLLQILVASNHLIFPALQFLRNVERAISLV